MLERIKLALRISHDKLDEEIEVTIKIAKLEMIRVGINADKVNSDDLLIYEAIKTYCQYSYAVDQAHAEAYYKSFCLQIDNLRNTAEYSEV